MVNQIRRFNNKLQKIKDRLLKIPAVRLIFLTVEAAGSHDVGQRAAGIAYYAFLSIFPALLGLIALFGFFLPNSNLQDELLNFIGDNIPGAGEFLNQNIANIIELRGGMGVLSIVILFWGASVMFGAISLAINRAWDIKRYHRNFFIRKASEVGMVLGLGFVFLLSLAGSTAISMLRRVVGLPLAQIIMVEAGGRLIAFLLILVVFLLLYKFIPNAKTCWRYIWPGALLASVLFEIARTLLVFYFENFANYHLIYGSITSIIILLVWVYYSAFIMILGAEFTFQFSCMRQLKPANSKGFEPVES